MTPEDQLTVPTSHSPATTSQEASVTSLDATLHQVAVLKSEMLVYQQESEALGQHTDENLAKIRVLLGKK